MPMRTFVDQRGTIWDVFEAHPSSGGRSATHVPDAFRMGWLCFQSADERRRLAPIPPGWDTWDERELVAALHGPQATPRRTPKAFDAARQPRHSGESAQFQGEGGA